MNVYTDLVFIFPKNNEFTLISSLLIPNIPLKEPFLIVKRRKNNDNDDTKSLVSWKMTMTMTTKRSFQTPKVGMSLPERSKTFLVRKAILYLFGTGDLLLFSKTHLLNEFMITIL